MNFDKATAEADLDSIKDELEMDTDEWIAKMLS